jgi:hypothetical protein
MTIIYSKQIVSLQCYVEIDGESDVVFTINWNLIGNEDVYSSSLPCATSLTYTAGQTFIPYAELTEEQVLTWINEYTTPEWMTSYENTIASNIEQQKLVVKPPLPWQPSLT